MFWEDKVFWEATSQEVTDQVMNLESEYYHFVKRIVVLRHYHAAEMKLSKR